MNELKNRGIAGILSPNGRVLGLMPHPERAVDPLLGSADGLPLFRSLLAAAGAVDRVRQTRARQALHLPPPGRGGHTRGNGGHSTLPARGGNTAFRRERVLPTPGPEETHG